MTLSQVIQAIELTAAAEPAVASIVRRDIRRLNDRPDWRYGAFGWVQGVHTAGVSSDIATYSFTLFYVDRLTADKANTEGVQSVGCEVLGNILRLLDEQGIEVAEGGWRLHPFNQRFKDDCAGVWCDVQLQVPIDQPCGVSVAEYENTGDFNADFNEDFNCEVWTIRDKEIFVI